MTHIYERVFDGDVVESFLEPFFATWAETPSKSARPPTHESIYVPTLPDTTV